ncbi:hypothetical protein ABT167_38155 [Streptomyces sp. NPDC001792]|uniref:IS1096 element passenger TnpR family protein n=1 Tax=Streptomyces sp. NPDC001792 TaxID=3154524 RepID=UPI00331CEFB7
MYRVDHYRGRRETIHRSRSNTGGRMAAMANSRSAKALRTAPGKTVHKIKITLRKSRPPVWHRLEVPSGITLPELHDVIQAAFGWEDRWRWSTASPDRAGRRRGGRARSR